MSQLELPPLADQVQASPCQETNGDGRSTAPAAPPLLNSSDRERRSALAMEANEAWLDNHEAELLARHPEWNGKWVVVADCMPPKVVAVASERIDAIEAGVRDADLVETAAREGVPPGSLATAMLLGYNTLDI